MSEANNSDVLAVLRAEISEVKGEAVDASDDAFREMHMIEDLGLDSLDMMTILFQVEQHFDLKIPEPDIDERNLARVGNMADYVIEARAA